jgi:hypothetical protein
LELTVRLAYLIEKAGTVNEFDCDVCRERGYFKSRACFKFEAIQPVAEVRPRRGRYNKTGRQRWITKDMTWRQLSRMEKWWPEMHSLQHALYCGVCPQGMLTNELEELLEMEALCKEYSTPPAQGSINEWPALTYDAFNVIRRTHSHVKKLALKAPAEGGSGGG